ncbi:amidase [Bdellovibrio svalbardensis]|uniref:Amidase n=1 Tax=Bdellovibrio svalbardensis TaxID=2972972 RepID=A0ABT6DGD8_9BACT|nr:amidase [Bdellovibrio svalbardensis]MDG0815910.1 amidase [Bdellovibrio svalbardensis]
MNELLKLSALEIAAKVAAKEVTPTEVLEAHIARIEEVNPQLNAMVEKDFVRARKLAAEQTEILSKNHSPLPPLFGVPFTVKEMFAYQGMKRTGGSVHHKNDVMDWDATIVARLKHAGAIPMGSTNVPELGFWFETYNKVYGLTNNPYSLERTPGGSSGGEGALIGAGASPIGVGSDIGGSIRMPATFCGIFGHKPSQYLLPFTGHFPYSKEEVKTILVGDKYPYTTLGPMSRKAGDLYKMMEIMMGPDGYDQTTLAGAKLKERPKDWSKVKVVLCADPVFHTARQTDYELVQVVKNCGKLFEELGAEVIELDPRFFVRSTELWFAALKKTKNKNFFEVLKGKEEKFSVGKELFKLAFGKGRYIFPNLIVSLAEILEGSSKDSPKKLAEELQALQKMHDDLSKILGPNGILILPPHPRVAPKHREPLWSPFDFIFTGIFTTLGMPATSIPMGLNEEGIPLGVQVVANSMNDHLTLGCAELLEQTFGGWVPPKE